jgi:hypothetical protein
MSLTQEPPEALNILSSGFNVSSKVRSPRKAQSARRMPDRYKPAVTGSQATEAIITGVPSEAVLDA